MSSQTEAKWSLYRKVGLFEGLDDKK